MELDVFLKKFADQFEDIDINEFKVDTYFQDLNEWSSLTVLSIIAFIKTEYGKDISGKEIRTCETVEDLYNYVLKL